MRLVKTKVVLTHLNVLWLAQTILQGTVKGKRRKDRQKKRSEDNIKEWTGMNFASSVRAPENRTSWKEVVAKSFVAPGCGID